MVITKHKRIAASGTVPLIAKTIALKQLVIVVSNAGTTWKIRVEDNAASPAIIVPPLTLTAPTTLAWVNEHFDEPLPMEGGLDFVTESAGTVGVLDIWYSFEQSSI